MVYYLPPKGSAIFRPDSRNGHKDFYIDREVAKQLHHDGIIYGDATNGGYMPSPNTPPIHQFKAQYELKPEPAKKRGRPRR